MMNIGRKKIVFAGYYGKRNIGDDVFCYIAAWGKRYYWCEEESFFLSKSIPVTSENSVSLLSGNSSIKGQRVLESVLHLFFTEWLVFAGGSLFQDVPIRFSSKKIAKVIKKYSKLQLGAIGVSVGPFANKEAETCNRDLLSQFSFLALRDKRSYDLVQSMGLPGTVIESRDLAFLMPKALDIQQSRNVGGKLILGVTLCRYESFVGRDTAHEKRRFELLAETIRLLVDKVNVTLRLFIFNGHHVYGDEKVTEDLCRWLKSECENVDIEIIPYSSDVTLVYRKIAECNAVISTRLHGAIIAASLRVPFLLVEYHRKCTDFLDDLNWSEEYVIGDWQRSPVAVSRMLETLLYADREVVATLFWELAEIEKLAEENFRAVAPLITE